MHVVIFEGSRLNALAPLSLSRPTFTLGAGTGTLLDKHLRFLKPTRVTLWVRPQFEEWVRAHIVPQIKVPTTINTPLDDEMALLSTGRTLYLSNVEREETECVVVEEGDLIRKAVVRRPGLKPDDIMNRTQRWMDLFALPRTMPHARFIDHPWDLISWNEEALIVDSLEWRDHSAPAKEGPYHLVNGEDVLVEDGAKLSPGCVLDASKGPIMIGKGASIGSNAVLQGPCFIGQYATVSPQAIIRPGTSIGPVSKVGGEISNSIFFGASNKAHEGFLGDSYIGKWVNLGAGTTTSNLKNTYGEIDMRLGGKTIPTGRRFLGAIIGDHTKTAIGTRLTTGSYVGFNCMIATNGLTPKFVPSFTFLTDKGAEKFDTEKAIEVAKNMFSRRNRKWTEIEENLMRFIAKNARELELSQ
ncbi:MAG: hypothetical protein H7Z14_13625 [Anaerolineae bacterium]|nr:hypothetical protein [Phycisphaerae bacterium]